MARTPKKKAAPKVEAPEEVVAHEAPAIEPLVAEPKVKAKTGPLTREDAAQMAADAAKAAVDAVMPAVASAVMQASVPRVAGNTAQVPGYRPPKRNCYLCQQDERVCGGKEENHVKMVVYPQRFPEYGKWFRGAGINGVWYRSNGPGHKIVVPTAAVGSILNQVEGYERDERESERRRSGGNDLGKMAEPGTGESTRLNQPAQTGWR